LGKVALRASFLRQRGACRSCNSILRLLVVGLNGLLHFFLAFGKKVYLRTTPALQFPHAGRKAGL
jgi:hypothetical protein